MKFRPDPEPASRRRLRLAAAAAVLLSATLAACGQEATLISSEPPRSTDSGIVLTSTESVETLPIAGCHAPLSQGGAAAAGLVRGNGHRPSLHGRARVEAGSDLGSRRCDH